jgi:PAS domain S-box-containing protein
MGKVRVLYVSDNDTERKATAADLRSKGYSVSVATSGAIGFRLFGQRKFDVILCDLDKPEKNSLAVLENIRKQDPGIPFILLTRQGSSPHVKKAIKKGADHLVLLPADTRRILIAIAQTLEKAKLQKKKLAVHASLQMAVENAPDVLYSLNARGEFISLSPSSEFALGYKPEEFLGKSVFKLIHPDDRDRVRESFLRSAQGIGPKVKTLEFRMISKTGEVKNFEVSRRIIFENGRFIRNDGIARDITNRVSLEHKLQEYSQALIEKNLEMLETQQKLEQKNAEMENLLEELSRSAGELQAIIDANPGVILLVDHEGIIKASNRGVSDYFGHSPDKIINLGFDEFIELIQDSIEDHEKFRLQLTSCRNNPSSGAHIDISDFHKGGFRVKQHKPGTLSLTCCRVQDKKGKALGHLWIFTDITFILRADEQVHTIVDSSPIPTIITRLESGEILYANEELAGLVGLTPQELIGKKSPDFYYHQEDRKTVLESLNRDGYLRNFETRIKKVDGEVVWMIFSLVITEMRGEKVILGWLYDISQRKLAEEALAKERNFVSATLDTAGALVVVLDTKGRIVRFNRACETVTGYTFDEVKGRRFWDIFLIPEEIERIKGVFDELKAGYFPNQAENYWRSKDGGHRLIAWSNSALIDDHGAVEYIIGTGIDITEQRKAEEIITQRLKYEEGLAACSRTLLSDAADKDVLSDALLHLLTASDTSRVYVFENFEDPEDGLCLRLTHEVCAPGVSGNLDDPVLQHGAYEKGFMRWVKILSQGKPIQGLIDSFPKSERAILEPQGILSILVLPLWVGGQWFGFIGFDDVKTRREWDEDDIRLLQTAAEMVGTYIGRKKTDLALRESEERFRSYVEKANDIIYALKPDGTFSYVSPNWKEILGHDVSEVEGKSFVPFVHPDDLAACTEFFENVVLRGKKQSGIEYRVKHKDGQWRWHTSSASPLKDEQGNVLSYIGIAHDITEMKEMMQDLEKSNKNLKETQAQLVQSEKMASLGSLVAGIAHEINTPIGAVSSMYDTLSRTLENMERILESKYPGEYAQLPELQSSFKIIQDANQVIRSGTERVTTIVQRLKSFARLDEAELKTVDIHEGLEDSLTLVHHEIKHDITVIRQFGKIPPISCFPSRLNQVFLNLLINSRHAIKEKGSIRLKTYGRDSKVYIEFKDDGVGIPKEHLGKIFDPGFTTKGRGIGTGLGLSICYQIIQDHRGEITVESEEGRGTTFTIAVPTDLDKILENEMNQKV